MIRIKHFSLLMLFCTAAVVLAAPDNTGKNLQKAMSRVDVAGEYLSVQVTPKEYLHYLDNIPQFNPNKPETLAQFFLKRLHRGLGFHLVKSMASSSKEAAPGCWVFKTYGYMGAENMQLPNLFSSLAAPQKNLDFPQLPADTILAISFNMDAAGIYTALRNELQKSKEFAALIKNAEASARQKGIDINAILKSASGNFKILVAGAAPAGLRISVEIPDKTGAVAQIIRAAFNLPPNAVSANLPIFFIPAKITFRSGNIVLNTEKQAPANIGKLGDAPAFRNYISRIGSRGDGYFVMHVTQEQAQIVQAMLPPDIKGLINIKPFSMLSLLQIQREGVYSVSAADFSMTSLIGKGSFAVLGGMLLPALNQARDRARSVVCINNLKQIGLALHCYMADNQDALPKPNGSRGLQLLIDKKYLNDTKAFVCPSAKIQYPGNKLSATCPYIYVGGAFDRLAEVKMPSRTPLVFEKPGMHKKNVNVLFFDGHVETLPIANYTNPTQVIGYLGNVYKFPPELLDKLLRAAAEN